MLNKIGTQKMTPAGVLHNLEDWSFETPSFTEKDIVERRYSMSKVESDAIIPVLKKAAVIRPVLSAGDVLCPTCEKPVDPTDNYCRNCGQRLVR